MTSPSHARRIAFLTLSDRTGFHVYDDLAFEPLRRRGWRAEEIPWDAQGIDWSTFAAVVIRSTWDYQQRADDFMNFLDSLHVQGIPLFNNVDLVRWNLQKTYLRELASRGIPIVPTLWLDRIEEDHTADGLCRHWSVDQIVVKPLVGANADDTFRIGFAGGKEWNLARTTFQDTPCMVQPFVESIIEKGEYSLFYFGNDYSHCVLKRPKAGDFRVQEEHGGKISACKPPSPLQDVGGSVIKALPSQSLYARVDFVHVPIEGWCVIEVELIEPSLYFPYDDQSAERFAHALVDAIEKQHNSGASTARR